VRRRALAIALLEHEVKPAERVRDQTHTAVLSVLSVQRFQCVGATSVPVPPE
jgi:dsDNA-specific endonuclease/ATPase MutS2